MVDAVTRDSRETLTLTFRRRLRAAIAVLVLSLVGAAVSFWPGDGADTVDPTEHSVLIVGPGTRPLATGVRGLGLMAETHARTERLSELLVLAESLGHGYIALRPPQLYDFTSIDPDVSSVPEGASMAVVRVADGNTTFGTLSPSVDSQGSSAKFSALVLALFEQPYYARLLDDGIDRDALDSVKQQPLHDMQEARGLEQARAIIETQDDLWGLEGSWQEARDAVSWRLPAKHVGSPFASTQGFPLANGGLLLMVNQGRWTLKQRRSAALEHAASATLEYLSPATLAGVAPVSDPECDARFGAHIEGIIVNAAGDGIAVRRALDVQPNAEATRWRVDAWQLTDGPCPFEPVGLPDRGKDARMMGPVSSDGVMLSIGSSGHAPNLERADDWERPYRWRRGAWMGPGLVARAANLVRRGTSVSGLALVEPDAVEPRAGFLSARALFGRKHDELRVEHVAVVDTQTVIVGTGSCTALEVSFPEPVRRSLLRVPARDDIPRRADVARGRFKTRWLIPPDDGGWCGGMSFDRAGQRVVMKRDDAWRLWEFGVVGQRGLLDSHDAAVRNILVAPDGKHAVGHVWVDVDGEEVLTSEWLTLPSE